MLPFLRITDTATRRLAALERQCSEMVAELKTMNDHLSHLMRRESQLRAVLEREAELERYQTKLDDTLAKPGVQSHIEGRMRKAVLHRDPFLVLADFRAYADCQQRVDAAWRSTGSWIRSSIINVARAGKFSSDRSIKEYATTIWGISPVRV